MLTSKNTHSDTCCVINSLDNMSGNTLHLHTLLELFSKIHDRGSDVRAGGEPGYWSRGSFGRKNTVLLRYLGISQARHASIPVCLQSQLGV